MDGVCDDWDCAGNTYASSTNFDPADGRQHVRVHCLGNHLLAHLPGDHDMDGVGNGDVLQFWRKSLRNSGGLDQNWAQS